MLTRPTTATAAPRPGCALSVPAGSRRRSGGMASSRPPTRASPKTSRSRAPRAPSSSAAPAARRTRIERRAPVGRGFANAGRGLPFGSAEPAHRSCQGQQRQRQQRHQGQEGPAPGEGLRDIAGQGRPDQPGDHPRAGDDGDHARLHREVVAAGDDHVGDGRDRAGAQALHHPSGHDPAHVRRESGDQQPGAEEQDARRERRQRTAAICQAARHRDAHQVGQPEAGERPAVKGQAAELVERRRQDGRHRQALEADGGHHQQQARGQHALAGTPGGAGHAGAVTPARPWA